MRDCKVVIVGAGISGLTIGSLLAQKGIQVTVLEKEPEVGGLTGSVKYDGFAYDYGPHGIFENGGRAGPFINDLLGDQLLAVPKKSGVFLMAQYYDWPLKPKVIIKLPWKIKFQALFDLIYKKRHTGSSLKDYLLNRYGRTLYETDFEPYTRKFLDIDPLQLDPDWMKIGIKRAGAGEKLRMDSLWQVFFSLFKKRAEYFTYPRDGIIQFPKALAQRIIESGGKIINNADVIAVKAEKDRISAVFTEREGFRADYFIWTAPITIANRLLFNEEGRNQGLDYISMVFYNIAVNEKITTEYRWCYFVDADIFFPRCYISTLFSPYNSPKGKTALTAELTCRRGSDFWNNPQKYQERVIRDLNKVGLLRDIANVEGVYIEKVEYAYPIYRLGYREKVREYENRLKQYSNLILSGRQGTFWYCNMDHCVEQGIEIAEEFIREFTQSK